MVPFTIDSCPSHKTQRYHDAQKIGAYVLRRRNDGVCRMGSRYDTSERLVLRHPFGATGNVWRNCLLDHCSRAPFKGLYYRDPISWCVFRTSAATLRGRKTISY